MRAAIYVIWFALLQMFLVEADIRCWGISYRYGSLRGGTRIELKGQEFSSEQFNSPLVGTGDKGNKVWFRTSTAAVECDVIRYLTNTERITCDTRPAPGQQDTYIVSVEVDGQEIPCLGRGASPITFQYRDSLTPTITSVTPASGPPDSLVTIRGKTFTAKISDTEPQEDESKDDREILRTYWGSYVCNPADDDGNLHGVTLEGNGRYGTLTCKPNGTYIASQPMSFLVTKYYGRSRGESESFRVSGKSELYHYQSHAVVYSIEPTEGSTAGGTLVTVTGEYFDTDTNVLIGGVTCAVVNSTRTTIECLTGPSDPDMTAYPGGRGMNKEIWLDSFVNDLNDATFDDTSSDFRSEFTLDAAMSNSASSGEGSLGEGSRFVGRLRGFYVPPRSGYYMFSVACDDRSHLWLSNSSRPEDMVRIAYCPRHGGDYHRYPEATSHKIQLEGGRHYYMEASLLDYASTAYVNVGVHMYDTPFGKSDIDSAVGEKQMISVTTMEQSEVQILSKPADVPEVQILRVEYDANCTINVTCPKFTLSFQGQETDEFEAGVDPLNISIALNALTSVQTIGVDVHTSAEEGNGTYIISFREGTANLPEIEASVTLGSANITIEEDQSGILAFTDSFSIKLDGVESSLISFTDTAKEVQAVMTDMLTVECRLSGSGGDYYYEQDFEGTTNGTEYGTRSNLRPQCGRQSLANPEYVFVADTTGDLAEFDAKKYSQLCLGYRGSLSGSIELHVVWSDEKYKSHDDTITLDEALPVGSPNWQHHCIDLREQIERSHIGTQYRSDLNIQSIKLHGDAEKGYYIDNVVIGTNNKIYTPTSRAPTPNDIDLLGISVEKPDSDSFRFTLMPANCKSGFPLMGVVGATMVNGSSTADLVIYENNAWPANTSLQVARAEAASPAIGGTFVLSRNEKSTLGIHVSTTAEKMKSILQMYLDVGIVDVEHSGSCSAAHWNITWMTKPGSQPLLQVDDSTVTGHLVNSTTERLEEGRLLLGPIPGEFLRTFHYTPQVEVLINGIPSSCEGNCSYNYSSEVTPSLTAVTPTAGTGCASTSITLSGDGFSSSASEIEVTIGGVECALTASSDTSINCTVGTTKAGDYKVLVMVEGKGYAEHSNGTVMFTHELAEPTFTPSEGSTAGGTVITVSGCGFSDVISENNVTVAGRVCKVTSASHQEVECVVELDESGSADTSGLVNVAVNSFTEQSSDAFNFSSASIPVISSISPTEISVLGGGNLTVTGTGFTTSDATVTIGKMECDILDQTDTEMICVIPAQTPGSYNLKLAVGAIGFADVTAVDKFKYLLTVGRVSPSHGSAMGGTHLSIKGDGFGSDPGAVSVNIGDFPCEVETVANEEIACLLSLPTKTYNVTNFGRHETYGIGYQWEPQVLKDLRAGDTVTWEWVIPSNVQDVVFTVQQTTDEDSAAYDGTGFHAGLARGAGRYSYTFTSPGTYYYSSGPVTPNGEIYLTGVIHVLGTASWAQPVNVIVDGYEALHSPEEASSDANDSCTVSTGIDGCSAKLPVGPDPSLVYFAFHECSTPQVYNITPISGTSEDEIVITGEGFGDAPCQHDLRFGDHSCTISSANSTTLICTLDVSGEPDVGYWMPLSLTVKNLGAAGSTIESLVERSFTLMPFIGSISHTEGSTAGGLSITVAGTGFSAPDLSGLSVTIAGAPCVVESFNYTTIVCTTSPNAAGSYPLAAFINSQAAVVDESVTFEYSASLTATLTGVSPSQFVGPTTILSIEGSNLPLTSDNITVMVGGVSCEVTSVTTADPAIVNCTLGYVPAGTHDVVMSILDQGFAELSGNDTQVESLAEITLVTPSLGGKFGGQLIEIQGNGFVDDDTRVMISDEECVIQSVNASVIYCVTPSVGEGMFDIEVTSSGAEYNTLPYMTATEVTPRVSSVTPTTATSGATITIDGRYLTDDTSKLTVTIGDAPCEVTAAAALSVTCTLGEHSAGTYPIVLFYDNFGYANQNMDFEYGLDASATSVECGFGGGITLTVTGAGFDENSTIVQVCDESCPTLSVTTSEITCEVPAMPAAGTTKVCDVIVSLPDVGVNATVSDVVTYLESLTSYITDVSPRRGGTGGGTTLTITGTGFESSGNNVTIAGTDCAIQSESTTQIVCMTGAHTPTEMAKVRVAGATGIATQDNADFFYIDVWSSVYTWGGDAPPAAGDLVVIPAGNTILLDQSTPTLSVLLLQGGHMIFDEKDLELHAEYIIITDGGSLTVGTEDEPFQHEATIMMHGHVRSQELPMFGAKVLAVRNGTLDLHGKPVAVTWTHLATTVNAGDTTMTLKQPVDWNVGDQIVIATTSHRHSQVESEMLTITDVSSDNTTLTFTPELKYKHISMLQTIGGVTLETRAEVGLLTRNVKFRGSVQDEWTENIAACDKTFNTNQFATQTCFQGRFGEETGSDQYGAHIMLFAKEMDKDWIVGRISYIEVTHAGQAFRLGRYPIHFHMSGDITGSYVRGCGIYNTFNRAVTVHGVHGFLVEHNVAFNIMGHAFFLEDGIESGNTLQYNLAIFVRPSSSLLNVDITPAAYWITNPNNTVRHNAAAGGSHFGFWYNAPANPGGPSYTPDIFPRTLPLGEFRNNSAHAQGWYGIWIFPIYYPSEPALFDSLTAWEVERGAEATEVGRVQFHNFLISDAEASGLEYQTVGGVDWGVGGAYINNSVVIGYSDINDNDANGECTGTGVHLPKSRYLTVDGVKFVNFDRSGCTTLKACAHCKPDQGGFEHRFKNLEFVNAPNVASFKWEHETWFEDLDGTLTGTAGSILLPQTDLLPADYCQLDVAHSSGGAVPAAICDSRVQMHRMAWNGVTPSSLRYKDVILGNANGISAVPYHKKRLTHPEGWMATLIEGDSMNMYFENVDHVTNISYNARFDEFGDGEYVLITHNFTQRPDVVSVVWSPKNVTDDPLDPSSSSHGDFSFDNDTMEFTYIVTGNGASEPVDRSISLDVYRCYYQDCITPRRAPPSPDRPENSLLWSDIASWQDVPEGWGGHAELPKDGDDVQIPAGSYVRGCGIYNTFNRAVTVHGVHGFLVEHNVAFNIMGHAFFLEDGIESGNTLQYNLAIFVRPSSSLLNVDITPAAYWITNPNNTVRHNAAAGGSHFGFWYNAPANPGGPSYTPDIFPRTLPLGEFRNNSAHAQGWYGIWIFPIYYPSEPALFDSLTAWEVERGAEATEVGRVQFHNFLISDAEASGLEYQTVGGVDWGVGGAYINNSVVIGYSDINDNDANGECTGTGVHLPKSRYLTVDGVKFVNFDRSGCTTLKACAHCKPDQGGFEHRFKNLEFVNAPNVASFKWEHETWFEDLDGTLTGTAGSILLPQTDLLPADYCQLDVAHSSGGAVPAAICDSRVQMHRMAWNGVTPSSLRYKDVILGNANGISAVPYHKKRLTHPEGWMATLIEGDSMNMYFENVDHVTNISYNARFDEFGDGEYVLITHNFTQRPDVVSVVWSPKNVTDDPLDPSSSSHGDFSFDNDTMEFTYIVTGNGASEPVDRSISLDVYRCYYQDCITPRRAPPSPDRPENSLLWSDIASWQDVPEGWGGHAELPKDGDDVQIPAGVWMVADVPLPPMNKLVIYGTLEIEDTQNQVINATYIFLHGGRLLAGFNETAPFTHNLHILLQGNHRTPDMPLPNGPNMGSKVLGVFGVLDLHGIQRSVSWTQLAATVAPGDDTIELIVATNWTAGDEIVVTTTSYEAWQTETFEIKEKLDEFTFKLNGTFSYKHTAATHTLSDSSASYTISAEVGLLTRNILIEGADYPDLFEESFGARVLVGRFNQDGEEFVGSARISNVEFKHSGQEGWTDFYDPRYSLAFLDAGEVTEEATEGFPSYVKGCSFHNGFSTAIGVYGTHKLNVSDNVIHHVVGPGIVSWGDDTRLVHNLVTLVIFPGSYQDRDEPESLLVNGGIEIEKATRPILEDNTVAGSERVGFKVKGEPCDENLWFGNTAHSTHFGIHMFAVSQPECSQISSFYIWNSFDLAIYAQIGSSLLVTDSVFVDNNAAVMALITKPPATSHVAVDKFVEVTDSLIVGASPSYDCDAVDPESASTFTKHHPKTASGIKGVGFYVSSFLSGQNGAPTKPFPRVNKYPAISGISKLTRVTFANFENACGQRQVAIITNPESHDASHPVVAESLRFLDVQEDNYVFFHYPSVSKVNPADCVDMDCDGMKKLLIRDLDGSLLGSVGTVISKAEYEWNGDPRRGLGDYRIPRTMLTAPDGSRIEKDDLAEKNGIYRGSDSDCVWRNAWQAYECHNLDHMMMVVESLDADTETRRVSPVALQSGRYIDLINGPQDNGWCHGYTCQERISTFYAIVETKVNYRLDFTGTSPQRLRYHLLHGDASQSLVLSSYYTNPQRLDVYVNGNYVLPTNADMQNGEFTWKAPGVGETKLDYYPQLDSTVLGENYFDRDLNLLVILIRGSSPVDVVTTAVVMTTFGLPASAVDNFFEENLVQNLAALLNIPASKIRVVEIISESSRRRRRSAGEVELVLEIGDPPASNIEVSNGTNTTEAPATAAPGDSLSFEDLQNVQATLADQMQTGGLGDALNTTVTSMSMTDPVATPVDPTAGVRATEGMGGSANETGERYDEKQAALAAEEQSTSAPMEYRAPSRIIVVEEPGNAKERHPFLTQPKLKVVDAAGNIVENLGHSSDPWRLAVTLRSENGRNATVSSESATHSFVGGWINFTDLAIDMTGTGFVLDFTVVHPNSTTLTTTSAEFEVKVRPMEVVVAEPLADVIVGDWFDVALQLVDVLSGDVVTDLASKGLDSVAADASLFMPGNYRGELEGDLSTTFDLLTGRVTFSDLKLTSTGVSYMIQVEVRTDPPSDYDFVDIIEAFNVVAPNPVTYSGGTARLTLRFNGDYATVAAGREQSLMIYFLNQIATNYQNVTFSNVDVSPGSILIAFDVTGDVESVQEELWEDIMLGHLVLTFNGQSIPADKILLVDGRDYTGPTTSATGFPIWVIILIILIVVLLVVIVTVVILLVLCKKAAKIVSTSSSVVELHQMDKKSKDNTHEDHRVSSPTPTITFNNDDDDTQKLLNNSSSSLKDNLSTSSRSPRLNKPRRSPELTVTALPPGFTEGEHVYEKDDFEELALMVRNQDGTFQELGKVKVNMVGTIQDIREELRSSGLPPKVRERPFILLDEQLTDLTPEKEKQLVTSEVYAGQSILIRWVLDEDSGSVCICGLVGQFSCALCNKQSYCSPLCQSKDWPEHSMHCKPAPSEEI